jgi:1,4-alpha-glucan branching enzyme
MLDFSKTPNFIKLDPYLDSHVDTIIERNLNFQKKLAEIERNFDNLANFANWYQEMCFKIEGDNYVFREWAPNAITIFLIGECNNWQQNEKFKFKKLENGCWELKINKKFFKNKKLYRYLIKWEGGQGERMPSFTTKTQQDSQTFIFSAVIDDEKDYLWKVKKFQNNAKNPLIYEVHIGMSSEKLGITNFQEFREKILPRIIALGYNTLQLMALVEHPYYGSFGYQVSNFFAISSRFGNKNELKKIIDLCHQNNIGVIMDLVHSHAVKNEVEGLSKFDGTETQFFHSGKKGWHPVWDSRLFNYNKIEVLRFLLSNCAYYLNEFKIDGFRFDGVTSMIYSNHGIGVDFNHYDKYFYRNQDEDAITYLILANYFIHQNSQKITIAEDVSAYPGLTIKIDDGGLGFDCRLNMGITEFWQKQIKNLSNISVNDVVKNLTDKRIEEKTISYVESHDQALVGSKTLAFQLMDKEMYQEMSKKSQSEIINQGIAWHKIIRLLTLGLADSGYLNFIGNEFGHPEWIDFPREGNNYSYKFCRRLWGLVDNSELKYQDLSEFDQKIISLIKKEKTLDKKIEILNLDESNKLILFKRGELYFLANLNDQDCKYQLERVKYLKILISSEIIKKTMFNQEKRELFLKKRSILVFRLN